MHLDFLKLIHVFLFCLLMGTANTFSAGKVIKDIEFAKVGGQSLKLDLYLPSNQKTQL